MPCFRCSSSPAALWRERLPYCCSPLGRRGSQRRCCCDPGARTTSSTSIPDRRISIFLVLESVASISHRHPCLLRSERQTPPSAIFCANLGVYASVLILYAPVRRRAIAPVGSYQVCIVLRTADFLSRLRSKDIRRQQALMFHRESELQLLSLAFRRALRSIRSIAGSRSQSVRT